MSRFDGRPADLISSRRNPLVQQVRALHQARGRREQQLLLLEGTHLLQECRRLQLQPQRLIATERWLAMHPQLQGSDVVQPVSPEVLTAMATTDTAAATRSNAVGHRADGMSIDELREGRRR